jgi:hypothetical protein
MIKMLAETSLYLAATPNFMIGILNLCTSKTAVDFIENSYMVRF